MANTLKLVCELSLCMTLDFFLDYHLYISMMDLKIRVPDSCFLWMRSHWNGQYIFSLCKIVTLKLVCELSHCFCFLFKTKSMINGGRGSGVS